VLWSQAESELLTFTEQTRIPLLLTTGALAMPFPAEAAFGLGSMGAGRPSMEAITEADVIILLGTRVNFLLGFGQPPFFSASQRIVQFDIEPQEIDTNRRVDLAIVGDLRESLQVFNALDIPMPQLDSWRNRLHKKFSKFETQLQQLADSTNSPMHPMRLVSELEALRSDDSLLVVDGANSILWALLAVHAKPAGGLVISTLGDLEAIGAGVPQALALKRAHPDRQVILHTGDGSFGYGAIEMETAVRYGIPIVVVVHNDKGWGMTRDMQVEFFGEGHELGNQLGMVRYDRLVKALGGYGEFVEQPEDLKPALERALQSGLPACVNVMVDPQPKSPGLMMFMLMEVMLGKETYFDRIPIWMRMLGSIGLDRQAANLMLKYIDRMLHSQMK
jgi:acetolactate synthase-1/2/3 large subunit